MNEHTNTTAMERTLARIERLKRHAEQVLQRMDRGVEQESLKEAPRLVAKRSKYIGLINTELEYLEARLRAQEEHERMMSRPKRKVHKKRNSVYNKYRD